MTESQLSLKRLHKVLRRQEVLRGKHQEWRDSAIARDRAMLAVHKAQQEAERKQQQASREKMLKQVEVATRQKAQGGFFSRVVSMVRRWGGR